jgi:hypothetical protein
MLADRRRVTPDQSTFREISGVTVWSLLFTAASLALGLAVYLLFRPAPWLVDLDVLVRDPGRYSVENYALVAGSVVAIVGVATGLATVPQLMYQVRTRAQRGRFIGSESAWQRAFVSDARTSSRVYLRVTTDDGTLYAGTLIAHSPDFTNDDRELILGHPGLWQRQPKGDGSTAPPRVDLPARWQRVIIHASKITAITVGYLVDEAPADPPAPPDLPPSPPSS